MEYIYNFLNCTTLTAGQQILVVLISSFVMQILSPFFRNIYNSIKIYFLNPIRKKYYRYKRLIQGKLNMKEYIDLNKKVENGKALSKLELRAYNKTIKQMSQILNTRK